MNESAPACLAVMRRDITLRGKYGKYSISTDSGSITLDLPEAVEYIEIPADKLPYLISELTAIMRHIPELSKSNEMW